MINDKYHTWYDLVRESLLSYHLPVSRRADPKKDKVGSGLANRAEGRKKYVRKEFRAKRRWECKVRFERGAEVRTNQSTKKTTLSLVFDLRKRWTCMILC